VNNYWLLKDLFTNTPNVVLAVDQHFHIFDLNPAAASLLGLPHEQVVGQHCGHLMKCRNMNRTLLCGTSNCPVTRVVQHKLAIAQEELILGHVIDSPDEFACSIVPVEH
jgi:PAS domain-containing protein